MYKSKPPGEYKTRTGKTQYKPSVEWCEQVMKSDNATGWCLACQNEQDGCEPDAQKYVCENCGEPKVYGVEELVMMGLIYFPQTSGSGMEQ